jgi:hypothetical protein
MSSGSQKAFSRLSQAIGSKWGFVPGKLTCLNSCFKFRPTHRDPNWLKHKGKRCENITEVIPIFGDARRDCGKPSLRQPHGSNPPTTFAISQPQSEARSYHAENTENMQRTCSEHMSVTFWVAAQN